MLFKASFVTIAVLMFEETVASSKSEEACKRFGGLLRNGEYPEIASLAYVEHRTTVFGCNGVLISEKFVLTPAHCLKRINNLPSFVRLGFRSI